MNYETPYANIDSIRYIISQNDEKKLTEILRSIHSADIAEMAEELWTDELLFILKVLSHTKWANVLSELDEDIRLTILNKLSPEEIAYKIEEMDTDDAADILSEIGDEEKDIIFSHIHDKEHVEEIQELSRYEEGTAWALMAKEYVDVKEEWTIDECLKEVRRQAQEVERIHSVYLVNEIWKLTGRVSLKDLISAPSAKKISEIRKKRVDSVTTLTPASEVAYIMEKYNLEAIPVVNEEGILLGRITIDDVIDFVRGTAEENYNLASWLSQDTEADDSLKDMLRARLPWLFIALFWWAAAVSVLWGFETALSQYPELFFFIPLIAAMAWNVWVQSSAIVVQWLANGSFSGSYILRFMKELLLSFINGSILSLVLFCAGYFLFSFSIEILLSVSLSLISVILLASIIGTFVPLTLHRFGVNPAVATWPFITTSNDIFGILIFFSISKIILGF